MPCSASSGSVLHRGSLGAAVKVHIPSPLQSYTGNQSPVESRGADIRELLDNLEQSYPGIRFRIISEQDHIRPHIKIFVRDQAVPHLDTRLSGTEDIHIICALSGGALDPSSIFV